MLTPVSPAGSVGDKRLPPQATIAPRGEGIKIIIEEGVYLR